MTTSENDQRLIPAILTQGVVDGLRIQPSTLGSVSGPTDDGGPVSAVSDGHVLVGPNDHSITVGPGTGLDHVGRLLTVRTESTIELDQLVDGADGVVGHLYMEPVTDGYTEPATAVPSDTPAAIRAIRSGDPIPRSAVPIALIRRDRDSSILQLSTIQAWLNSNGLLIGSPDSGGLALTDDAIVAGRVLHLVGGGRDAAKLEHHVVIGPRRGPNLSLGGDRIAASTDGSEIDLHIQSDGGEVHFGGAVRGPEREPLTILGGFDVSLSGGGVLMLGDRDGANLVLDENEIMAREDGANAPLLLQWEGGDTRFGGVIRGPAEGPLNVVGGNDLSLGGHGLLMVGPADAAHLLLDENEIMARAGDHNSNLYLQWRGGETHFGGPIELTSSDREERIESWRIEASERGRLIITHDGVPHSWFDPAAGTMFSNSAFSGSAAKTGLSGTGPSGPGVERSERQESSARFLRSDSGSAEIADSNEELDHAVSVLRRLRPLRSIPASEDQTPAVGFDPSEISPVAPELVDCHRGVAGVSDRGLLTYAIAAIKEQQRTIDALERRVDDLESAAAAAVKT